MTTFIAAVSQISFSGFKKNDYTEFLNTTVCYYSLACGLHRKDSLLYPPHLEQCLARTQ